MIVTCPGYVLCSTCPADGSWQQSTEMLVTQAEPALSAPGSVQVDMALPSGSCLFHVILQLGIIDHGGSGAQVLLSFLSWPKGHTGA